MSKKEYDGMRYPSVDALLEIITFTCLQRLLSTMYLSSSCKLRCKSLHLLYVGIKIDNLMIYYFCNQSNIFAIPISADTCGFQPMIRLAFSMSATKTF